MLKRDFIQLNSRLRLCLCQLDEDRAGAGLQNDVVSCQLKPLDPEDYRVEFTEAEWAELEEVHRDASGEEVNRSTQRTSWKDLQSHASFPREQTELSEESCETRSGTWNCWRYDVKKEGSTERYWFAKDKPGPPVKLEVLAGGAVVFTMELIELQHPS